MRTWRLTTMAVFFIRLSMVIFAQGFTGPGSDSGGFYPHASPATGAGLDYGSTQFNSVPGRYDRNGDGRIDLIIVDRNGDGIGDYWATDRDFDGLTDDYQYDRNFDGKVDQWEYDADHDGVPEKIYIDTDGNGKADLFAELNPLTKTYSWYGNLESVAAAGGSTFGPLTIKPVRKLARGKAANSM
ncbi:MAG: hypothetical protein HQM09_01515 [Candidatus Riflebacteria bacterium]|nr:hypothetical protein [Candidatus Riflebacteria bacterium]